MRWHFDAASNLLIPQMGTLNVGELPFPHEVAKVCFDDDGVMTSEVPISFGLGNFPEALVVER